MYKLYILLLKLQSSLPVRPATKVEQMRECLRSLKQNHKVIQLVDWTLDYNLVILHSQRALSTLSLTWYLFIYLNSSASTQFLIVISTFNASFQPFSVSCIHLKYELIAETCLIELILGCKMHMDERLGSIFKFLKETSLM